MVLDCLYNTVRDDDNADYVENNGPFLSGKNSWLGKGYYFWDNMLPVAHWWGKYHCKGSYIISEACARVDDDKYLDLYGNLKQKLRFRDLCYKIRRERGERMDNVSSVINLLINQKNFPFQAVRVESRNCGYCSTNVMPFVTDNDSYLEFDLAVQVCIYDKSCIKGYRIIYPREYIRLFRDLE